MIASEPKGDKCSNAAASKSIYIPSKPPCALLPKKTMTNRVAHSTRNADEREQRQTAAIPAKKNPGISEPGS